MTNFIIKWLEFSLREFFWIDGKQTKPSDVWGVILILGCWVNSLPYVTLNELLVCSKSTTKLRGKLFVDGEAK